ncbi:MAG: MFS transporter [Candidatus Bathyarchaeota archaeon]|nr:MAG: MFS transporter [Candidatus Bathyarchaeota archaeon]
MSSILSRLRDELSFIRGNLLVLIVSYMMFRFSGGLVGSFYSLYVRELGATPFVLGLIGSLGSAILAFVRIPGAYIADRYGRKNIIVVFTYGAALSFLIYSLAPDWRFIVVATFMSNLCNVYLPALEALEADSIPLERRGMGYASTQVLPHITVIVAPLVSGYFVETMGLVPGMRVTYIVALVGGLLAAVTRTFFLRETLETSERVRQGDLREVFTESFHSISEVWRVMPRNVKYFTVAMLILSFQGPFFGMFHALYANDVVGVKRFQWSFMSTVNMLIGLVLGIPVGRLIDAIGRKRSMLLRFLFSTPVVVLMVFSRGFLQHLVVIILFAVSGTFFPAFRALQADMIPREARGRVLGVIGTLRILATVPSAALGGLLYQTHPALPFALAIVLQLISVSIIYFKVQEPSVQEV